MARDYGLEEVIREDLGLIPGLAEKPMFGGLAWLLGGHLLCGARDDGLLIRLGKGNDAWALEIEGIRPMTSGRRAMTGWVRAEALAFGDDAIRARLIAESLAFVRSLPPKS